MHTATTMVCTASGGIKWSCETCYLRCLAPWGAGGGAVGCGASGLWRTGGREYAGTVHNHKTIAFPHIDGLAWLLNTHSVSGVSTGVAEAPVSHARNQRVRQAPTTASDRQSVPCHVVTL